MSFCVFCGQYSAGIRRLNGHKKRKKTQKKGKDNGLTLVEKAFDKIADSSDANEGQSELLENIRFWVSFFCAFCVFCGQFLAFQ